MFLRFRGLYNIALKSLGAAMKRHPDVRLERVLEYAEPILLPPPEDDTGGELVRDDTGGDLARDDTGGELARDVSRDDTGGGLARDVSRDDTGGDLARDVSRDDTRGDVSRDNTGGNLSREVSEDDTRGGLTKDVSSDDTRGDLASFRDGNRGDLARDVSRDDTGGDLAKAGAAVVAEAPEEESLRGPGYCFMDSPGNDLESLAGQVRRIIIIIRIRVKLIRTLMMTKTIMMIIIIMTVIGRHSPKNRVLVGSVRPYASSSSYLDFESLAG